MKEHKQLIEDYIFANEKILGGFYGGSIARNDSDIYSDIDLRILIDKNLSKYKILLELINLFDDKLIIESQTNEFAVLHLKSLLKIDIFIFYPEDLTPNIWLSNIRIIEDRTGFLKYVKYHSKGAVKVTPERITFACSKFLAYLIESHKRQKRNEMYYVDYLINMMANILCHLWYLKSGEEPNSIGDWSKYEGNRSKLKVNELKILNSIMSKSYVEQREILNKEFLKVLYDIDNQYNFNNYKDKKHLVNLISNKL